ncbi:MAG: hypothetical protein NVS3B10_11980 [Polyangiales bacterium]
MKLVPCLPVALGLALGLAATPALADDTDDCSHAYELGQRLRQQSQLVDARKELVICAQDRCPAVLRKDCVGWLAEVTDAIPAIAIQARGSDGCDRPLATAWIDGALVTRGADGRPIDVDPGPHTVRVEVDGAMIEQVVVVSAGDRRRVVTLAPAGGAAGCGVGPPPSPSKVETPLVPRTEGPRPVPAIVYVLGTAGLVSLGIGSGFGIAGWSQKGTLDHCKGNCPNRDVDTMQRTFLVSDVAVGVGVVALAAATVLYLTRSSVVRSPP